MRKQLLPLLLVLLMLLAACQGGGSQPSAPPTTGESGVSSAPAQPAAGEESHIKVMIAEFVNAPLTVDAPGIVELQKRVGVKLEFEVMAGGADEINQIVSMAIASGDLADLQSTGSVTTAINPYLSSGLFVEFSQILSEKMPNVRAAYEEYGMLKDIAQDDGTIYALSSINGQALLTCNTTFYNLNWLEQCGLTEADLPETTDELLELLRTFKQTVPDGIPMTGGQWMSKGDKGQTSVDGPFLRAFGSEAGWRLFEDGVYTYGPYGKSEEYRQALAYMNTLYTEGLLDAEYVTHTDDDIGALVAEDKVGFLWGWVDNGTYPGGNMEQYVRGTVLNKDQGGYSYVDSPVWTRWVVPEASEVKEDTYRMLDYIMSEEGQLLFSWGIEGESFEVVDGEKKYTDLVMDGELPPLNQRRALGFQPHLFFHIWDLESAEEVLPEGTVTSMMEDAEYAYPQPPYLAPTEEETLETNAIMTDVVSYVKQTQADFINGTLSVENDFDSFLAQLETLGIQRAIEIKQAQYERYLAR